MFLGLFSLIMIATGFSIIIGSVGVILALLSRGAGHLSGRSKAGFITSLIGLIGGIAVTVVTYVTLFSGNPDQVMERLNTLYQTYINQGTLDSNDVNRIFTDDTDHAANPAEQGTEPPADAAVYFGAGSDQTALAVTLSDGEVLYL